MNSRLFAGSFLFLMGLLTPIVVSAKSCGETFVEAANRGGDWIIPEILYDSNTISSPRFQQAYQSYRFFHSRAETAEEFVVDVFLRRYPEVEQVPRVTKSLTQPTSGAEIFFVSVPQRPNLVVKVYDSYRAGLMERAGYFALRQAGLHTVEVIDSFRAQLNIGGVTRRRFVSVTTAAPGMDVEARVRLASGESEYGRNRVELKRAIDLAIEELIELHSRFTTLAPDHHRVQRYNQHETRSLRRSVSRGGIFDQMRERGYMTSFELEALRKRVHEIADLYLSTPRLIGAAHGDFHPGNFVAPLLTSEKPRWIDSETIHYSITRDPGTGKVRAYGDPINDVGRFYEGLEYVSILSRWNPGEIRPYQERFLNRYLEGTDRARHEIETSLEVHRFRLAAIVLKSEYKTTERDRPLIVDSILRRFGIRN